MDAETESPTIPVARERPRLEHLYGVHAPAAARLAFLLTGDRHVAEDLVHDAFVRLAARFQTLRSPDAFGAYLERTIVTLSYNRSRRAATERRYLARQAALPRPAAGLPDVETRTELAAALAKLTPKQRAAVVLRYYEDMSESRVADLLQCSPSAAKSLIHRGTEALRAHLGSNR